MITGKTKLYGVIADPVGHVRAPQVFNRLFEAQGIDAVLVPFHVAPGGLASAVEGFRRMENLGGLAITVPHKVAMAGLVDELGPAARTIGAINALRREPDGRLAGEMFDGEGFLAGLRHHGYEVAGRKVLLLGAGGAARAIAFGLAGAGVARLTVANRTGEKAAALVAAVRAAHPEPEVAVGAPDPRGHELVVNATSLGLHPADPLPLDPELLEPEMNVAEVIMIPETTPLLAAARQRGCPVHYGRPMLEQQVRLLGKFMGCFD